MSRISKAPDLGPVPENRLNKVTKKDVEDAIVECLGLETLMAVRFDTNMAHVRRMIQRFRLQGLQADCQKHVLDAAKATLVQSLSSQSEQLRIRAAEALLKQLPQTLVQVNSFGDADIRALFGT